MLCPHCSIAEISDTTHACELCGFSVSTEVLVAPTSDGTSEVLQEALAGRYAITAVLRLGRRSCMYLAQDVVDEQLVSLTVIRFPPDANPALPSRFDHRVRLAASLQHAHIVPILSHGYTSTFVWYASQYMRGRPLAEELRDIGPIDLERCLRLTGQMAAALDFAHRKGVVHGDVRPANIIVDSAGWVRLTDFAIRDAFGRRHPGTPDAPTLHDPVYMAPEMFYARTVGAAADQYALGVVVYECLAGSVPFVGDSFGELAHRHATEPPAPLSRVRPDLPVTAVEAVQRALAKVPTGRFSTVLDFAAALSGDARPSVLPGAASPLSRPSGVSQVLVIEEKAVRNRRRWILLAILVLLLAVAVLVAQPRWLSWVGERLGRIWNGIGGVLGRDAATP